MKLSLSNCGGIRFVPYGASSPVTYWWGTFREEAKVDGQTVFIRVKNSGSEFMMMPGFRDDSKPLLDIDGRVYIPGVSILADSGETFETGGYLGTRNQQFHFSRGSSSATIELPTLAIIHAAYSGGIQLRPMEDPGTTMQDSSNQSGYGTMRYNFSNLFLLNGKSCYLYNWKSEQYKERAEGVAMTARMRGCIGYDFHWQLA